MSNPVKQAFNCVMIICVVFALVFGVGIYIMKTIDESNMKEHTVKQQAKIVSANANKPIELIKPVVKQIDTSCIMWNPVVYLVEIEGNKYIFSRKDGYYITPVTK